MICGESISPPKHNIQFIGLVLGDDWRIPKCFFLSSWLREATGLAQTRYRKYLFVSLVVFFFFFWRLTNYKLRDVRRLQVLTNRVLLAIREIQQYKLFLSLDRLVQFLLRAGALSSVSTLSLLSPIKRAGATDTLHPTMVWPIIKLFLFRILRLLKNWIGSYNI